MICPVKPHTFCHFLDLREEFNRLARILKQLRQSCQTEEGEDDLKKGTQLLEVIEALSSEALLWFSGVCPRDPDVHSTEEQQEAEGLVRPEPSHQVGHSPPPNPGSHQVISRNSQLAKTETENFAGSAEGRCTCEKENLRKLTQTSLR